MENNAKICQFMRISLSIKNKYLRCVFINLFHNNFCDISLLTLYESVAFVCLKNVIQRSINHYIFCDYTSQYS